LMNMHRLPAEGNFYDEHGPLLKTAFGTWTTSTKMTKLLISEKKIIFSLLGLNYTE